LRTPGCTTATRATGSTCRIFFSLASDSTTPCGCGSAPAESPVPAPRATIGAPAARQALITATT
jgi:hypothetical protein